MNDVIFEQDKPLQRPYTAKDLLNRAKNPRLCIPQPKINPGSWLGNLLRRQRMTRAQIIEKVAEDLWLTLEKRDGVFVFRFPDVWEPKTGLDMQRTVLEGIAMLEDQCSLIIWLRDLFGNFGVGIAQLCDGLVAPIIAMTIFGITLLLGTIYAFSIGATAWGIALCIVALLCCSVKISVSHTEDEEKDRVPSVGLGGYIADTQYVSLPPQGGDATIPVISIDKLKERAMTYHGQETRKTLALMKDIEAELEERACPARKAIPWGYTMKECADSFALMGSALASKDRPLKSDDRYEEPQATYPMEMKL